MNTKLPTISKTFIAIIIGNLLLIYILLWVFQSKIEKSASWINLIYFFILLLPVYLSILLLFYWFKTYVKQIKYEFKMSEEKNKKTEVINNEHIQFDKVKVEEIIALIECISTISNKEKNVSVGESINTDEFPTKDQLNTLFNKLVEKI